MSLRHTTNDENTFRRSAAVASNDAVSGRIYEE
jgi:hypothetical protein